VEHSHEVNLDIFRSTQIRSYDNHHSFTVGHESECYAGSFDEKK
jgi:hypothetical protein